MTGQLSLLDACPVPAVTVRQRRDRVLRQVAAKCSRRFLEDAAAAILAHLRAHGPTSGERLTEAAKAAGCVPKDDRAFGPVFHRLATRRQIVKVGSVARAKGNGTSGGNVWALC